MGKATEEVLFVEYHDGRPFTVVTTKATYDAEWCKRDGCLYFHDSGSGGAFVVSPGSTYWLHPDCSVVVPSRERPYYRPPMSGDDTGTRLAKPLPEYSLAWILSECGDDTECEYCPTCDDYLPSSDCYTLCDHVFWCDAAGWWSKPGERCPDDCEDCLERGHPTKGHEYPTGFIGTGHGSVAQDYWSEHTGHWDRRQTSGFFWNEDWPWIAVGCGIGVGALVHFESIERKAVKA